MNKSSNLSENLQLRTFPHTKWTHQDVQILSFYLVFIENPESHLFKFDPHEIMAMDLKRFKAIE